jgi:hypothetical protein
MSDSPAMISAPRLCPKCGAEIPSDAPEGGCPRCLLYVGLLPETFVADRDASTVTATKADECGSSEKVEANTAAAGDHGKEAERAAETPGNSAITNYWKWSVAAVRCGLPGSSEKPQPHRGA